MKKYVKERIVWWLAALAIIGLSYLFALWADKGVFPHDSVRLTWIEVASGGLGVVGLILLFVTFAVGDDE